MNQIANRTPGLPVAFRAPALPPIVAGAVAHYLNPDPHAGPRVRVLAPALRDKAGQFVAEADASDIPAGFGAVNQWLLMVSNGVGKAPPPEEFPNRVSAITAACADLPGWGFNADTATRALREFRWFPSAAEVHDLISDATKAHRDTVRALRALAEAQEPVKALEAPQATPEERAAVAAALKGVIAEAQGRADASETAPPEIARSRCLTPDVIASLRARDPRIQAAIKMREQMKGAGQ